MEMRNELSYRCNPKSALQMYDLSEECRRTSHDNLQYQGSICCFSRLFSVDQASSPSSSRLAVAAFVIGGYFPELKKQSDGKDLFHLANPWTTRCHLALF